MFKVGQLVQLTADARDTFPGYMHGPALVIRVLDNYTPSNNNKFSNYLGQLVTVDIPAVYSEAKTTDWWSQYLELAEGQAEDEAEEELEEYF